MSQNVKSISHIVSGKEVAFVGMAPNIEGKGFGDEIDSFDVIIRTNFFPVEDILQKDYGTVVNIMSVLSLKFIKEEWLNLGLQCIVHYSQIPDTYSYLPVDYYHMNRQRRSVIEKGVRKVTGVHPKQGTAGINIAHTCLNSGVKRLKMFGVTGYQNKQGQVVDHTEALHYVRRRRKDPSTLRSMRNHPAHNLKVQNDYLRILLSQGKIQMDEYSIEYFSPQ